MTTNETFKNRSGQTISVGDRVAVFSFTEVGIEGGVVVALSVTRGVKGVKLPMARIERADGSTFAHRVLFLESVR